MLKAVWVVVVGVVLAACGDPPPDSDPTADLQLECVENCGFEQPYQGVVTISTPDPVSLVLGLSNGSFAEGRLEFRGDLENQFQPSAFPGYEIDPRNVDSAAFFYRCTLAGRASVHVVGGPAEDTELIWFDLTREITCASPNLPDIEVLNENGLVGDGGMIGLGTRPAGVRVTREYTVKNVGPGPLTIGTLAFTNQTNCTGAVLTAPPALIPPGISFGMTIGITPIAVGSFECTLSIPNNDPDENPFEITFTGQVAPPPVSDIAVVATSTGAITDGGQHTVGVKPAGVSFTELYRIDNEGLATLTLGQVSIGVLVNCTVTITTPPSTSPLPAQTTGVTNLALSITPSAPGAFMCNVSIPSDDPDENPFNWTVTGTATAPEIDVANQPDASSVDLGAVRAGTAVSRSFLVSNTGTGTLTISAVTPGTMTNCTLTVTMAPAASVMAAGMTMFTISVTPTAEGPFSCGLDIANNDADEAFYDLFVIGTGVLPKIALESPNGAILPQTTDNMGGGYQATIAFSRTYTIRNTGTAPLVLTGVSTLTPVCNNCSASITQPAMTTVPVGGSTTFSIQFTPTAAGTFGHSFRIGSDSANLGVFEFAASGTATPGPAPSLRVLRNGSPVLPMMTDNIGTFSSTAPIELVYNISNTGDANLVVTSVDTPGVPPPTNATVVVSGGTGTVTPLTSSTFSVTVTPQGVGTFGFQLRVFSNDPSYPTGFVFAVSGTVALPPEIDIPGFSSGTTDAAGTRPAGVAFTRTYTINNTGSGQLTLGTITFTTSNCTASVTTAPATPVAASGSTTMSIAVTPTATGPFSCTVNLPNNDTTGNEAPYQIVNAGTGGASIGNFAPNLGSYFGDNNCDIQTWSLEDVGGLRVDGVRDNPDDFPLTVGADPNVATGTNFVIFGTPGATCTFTRQSNFSIVIFCSHPGGGSCQETASRTGP